jgi:hypothetical protein
MGNPHSYEFPLNQKRLSNIFFYIHMHKEQGKDHNTDNHGLIWHLHFLPWFDCALFKSNISFLSSWVKHLISQNYRILLCKCNYNIFLWFLLFSYVYEIAWIKWALMFLKIDEGSYPNACSYCCDFITTNTNILLYNKFTAQAQIRQSKCDSYLGDL